MYSTYIRRKNCMQEYLKLYEDGLSFSYTYLSLHILHPLAVECSMNDCLFGLAENMDLWPPEGGGFVKPKQSDESAYPTSAPPIPDTDDDNFSFRDSAILNTPPQLPPRTSPSLPRKMELEIEKNANNNNSRLRSVSLTHNDDKL